MWIPDGKRYFLWRGATDMRKSFNGLGAIVRNQMHGNLLSGDVFIFINRRRDRMKLMCWDRTGFLIWYKRLEEGTFELPPGAGSLLSRSQLILILEGIALASVKQRKRYTRA